jgi:hypothetical protein
MTRKQRNNLSRFKKKCLVLSLRVQVNSHGAGRFSCDAFSHEGELMLQCEL